MRQQIALALFLTACGSQPSEVNPSSAMAAFLAKPDVREAIQDYVTEHGNTELAITTLDTIEMPDGTLVGDQLDVDLRGMRLVAPDGITPELFEQPPLVAYVDDADAKTVTFTNASGHAETLPLGQSPTTAFVVLRPAKLTITNPIVADKAEIAEATTNVYLREIRVKEDNDFASDEEIYTRCKEISGSWEYEDITGANDTEYYNLWDYKIRSILYNQTVTCEIREEDTIGCDYLGSFGFSPNDLTATEHDSCMFFVTSEADVQISKHKGYDQCPSLNFLGIHCAEDCWAIN
jgi:hypothetical protein